MSCPDNNRMQTRMVSYEEALNGKVSDSDLVSLRMKYLNPEKRLRLSKSSIDMFSLPLCAEEDFSDSFSPGQPCDTLNKRRVAEGLYETAN